MNVTWVKTRHLYVAASTAKNIANDGDNSRNRPLDRPRLWTLWAMRKTPTRMTKSVVRPTVVEIVRTLESDATNQKLILNPTIAKKRKVPKSAKPIVVERK